MWLLTSWNVDACNQGIEYSVLFHVNKLKQLTCSCQTEHFIFTAIKSFFDKSSLLSEATEIGGKKASNSDMHIYGRHVSYLSEKSWTYPQINILQTVLILVYVISEIEYPKHKYIYLQAI